MPYQRNYPATVVEVLADRKYKPEVLRALRAFRRAKAWRGTVGQRTQRFAELHRELCRIYRRSTALYFEPGPGDSGSSCYVPVRDQIILRGRLSVVTYLHEFAHALGKDERGACAWSINLFRRIFPRSYARCEHVRHTLVKRNV